MGRLKNSFNKRVYKNVEKLGQAFVDTKSSVNIWVDDMYDWLPDNSPIFKFQEGIKEIDKKFDSVYEAFRDFVTQLELLDIDVGIYQRELKKQGIKVEIK